MCKKFIALLLVFTLIGTFGFSPSVFADTVVGSSDNGDGTYTNPVIWADVPDQDVIRVGDTYYMSSTTMHMCPGVPIMKSYDLINWETISYCYLVLDDSDATTLKNGRNMYGNGTWASSLKYKDGTFYVVVPSPTTNKTYIFQTEDPENQPWRRYEINARYHDCSLLLDDDGRNWLVYGNNPLYIIELNETVTGVKEGASPRVLIQNIHAPDPITGVTPTSGLAEGAHIQKINGKYYIFCITWPSGKPRTEVCHRGDSLDGPFEAKTVAQENIIIGGQGGGPAQGNIVDDGKGNWYGFLFRDSGAVGRIPWVMPIHWSDGWPMFGDDDTGLHLTRGGPKPIQGDFELKSVVTSDEFDNNAKKPTYNDAPLTPAREEYAYNGSNLKLEWQWNHNPDNRYWSLTERPGWLRLTTGQMATNLLDARNTLTQRTIGPVSSVQTKLDVSNMKNGDRAGLALFTAQYGTIEVRMDDDVKTLVMVNSSSTTTHNDVESIPLPTDIIYLKVDADFRNQTDKGTFYYSFDGVNWVQLGNTQQMVYSINNHFMGYRFALYNYATKTLGGYVDFDYFRISDTLEGSNVDLSLKELQINGSQVAGFNPNIKTYDITVPIGSVPPTVTAVANDPNVNVTVTQADTVPGKATVTVSLGLLEDIYTVNFIPDLTLKDIKVDGMTIAGFSPNKYSYNITIPPESDIPEVTAVPNDPNAIVEITQASAIPGVAIITVTAGDSTVTYTINIDYAPPTIVYSFMDGTIDSGWTILNPDPSGYSVVPGMGLRLPTQDSDIYSTGTDWKNVFVRPVEGDWEVVSAVYYSTVPYANYQQNALLIWQDEDNYIKLDYEYNNGNLFFQMGQEVASSFTSLATVTYDAPAGTPLNIYYKIKKTGNNYTGYYSLDGTNYTVVGSTTIDLQNTQIGLFATKNSENDPIDTYVKYVEIHGGLNTDASLKDLLIDGVQIIGFDPSITSYDITLPAGTTIVPTVTAIANDSNATVTIEPATSLPGTTNVIVTAQDGKTKIIYIINFEVEVSPATVLTTDSSVRPGATFTVGIGLNNLEQIVHAYDITLSYDSDVFEYVSAAGTGENIVIVREDKATAGKIRLIAANIGRVSGESTPVMDITFKVKDGVENTTGIISVTGAKLGIGPQGTVIQATPDSKSVLIGSSEPSVDKTALIMAIDNAQSLYDAAVVGTQPGQYPQAAKEMLKAAIDAAKEVRDDTSATQSQVDSAVTALSNAIDIFMAAVVEKATPDINEDGIIDVADLGFVAYYYGKECTGTEWLVAKAADMNGDGKIDIEDLAYVAIRIED